MNYSKEYIDTILADLDVTYDDPNVLLTNSPELELVNYFFNSITCGNKEVENLLYEVIGYSMTKTAKLNKAFIFKGNGRNGKSKIFRIIEALVGAKQCSHEHLENLSGSKAGSKSTVKFLEGCTVNIAEDQKQVKYINTSLITRVISGEPISIEQKGKVKDNDNDKDNVRDKDNIVLKPYATMLFSVNEVIDFKETGLYITDRFLVIPFNATFTDSNNNRNINIGEDLCQPLSLQIIATKAIEAFKEVLKNGKFTIPDIVEEATKQYFMECNNVAEFCSIHPIETIMIKSRYYKEYCKWCKDNNREAVSNSQFGKEVLALGYRAERYSFGKKRNTYYASPDFNNENSRNIYDKYLQSACLEEMQDKTTTDSQLKSYDKKTFDDYLSESLYNGNNDIENTN